MIGLINTGLEGERGWYSIYFKIFGGEVYILCVRNKMNLPNGIR